jgi:hypothetical protein
VFVLEELDSAVARVDLDEDTSGGGDSVVELGGLGDEVTRAECSGAN